MLVNFYIGGMAAILRWDIEALDKYAYWCLFMLIGICAGIVLFRMENRELFRLVSPFLVWPSMRLITGTHIGDWLYRNARSSFFIFLSHSVILLSLWLLFKKTPISDYYFVYWLITPPVTVIFLIFMHRKFKEFAPRISYVLLGGRE